jgi:tetratricopeptide (TPR) repeat protein
MASPVSEHDAISAVLQRAQRDIRPELTGATISERIQVLAKPQTVDGARRCAELLQSLGFVSQSERLFADLASHFPDSPVGLAGLAQLAMNRKDWDAALLWWDSLISTFPQRREVNWINARARALEELGRASEVADDGTAASNISMAQAAMRSRRWDEALALWNELLASSPKGHPGALHWRTGRATAWLELGRHDDAERDLEEVLGADPWALSALRLILRVQCSLGRYAAALRELRSSVFGSAEVPALFSMKIQILAALGLFRQARESFALLLKHAADFEVFEMLFAEAPRLHEGWSLTQIRLHLLRELRKLSSEDAAPVDILRARIQLALRNYADLQVTAGRIGKHDTKQEIDQRLLSVADASRGLLFPDFQKPKIFGIGLSRTGTLTLATALETLGLRTLHWTNPLTGELISEGDLHLFDAFTDIPICTCFEKQFHTFPNAKFIYTTRPIESWRKSFEAHWQRVHGLAGFEQIKHAFASGMEFSYGSYFREIHSQLFLRHADAAAAYNSYDKRVRQFFYGERQQRFIEFNVFTGDSWAKLCGFLGKEIPDLPFPFENRRLG